MGRWNDEMELLVGGGRGGSLFAVVRVAVVV